MLGLWIALIKTTTGKALKEDEGKEEKERKNLSTEKSGCGSEDNIVGYVLKMLMLSKRPGVDQVYILAKSYLT